MNSEFAGLTGIVTGAGSGIGRAVSLYLAARGAQVLAVDVRMSAAEAVAAEALPLEGSIVAHQADVTRPDEVAAYAERAAGLSGRLWFFHSNAGVEGVHRSIIDTELDDWRSVTAINLDSCFYGLKYVLPLLVAGGGGAVVLTGSLLSLRAAANRSDYVATKHAVLGLTRTAAAEMAKLNVRVNCICPGPIETPLMTRSEILVNSDDPGAERRRFESGTPMGRYGTPEEVARSVAFLLSPEVPYLTGAALSLDGGLTAV